MWKFGIISFIVVLLCLPIWASDYKDPCELPKDPGPCKAYMPRWYYNSASGKCEKFIYGGCQGNANRFDTKKECQNKCDPCELPKDPGPCKAYMPRWYYNSVSGKCEKFIYGGCQGNGNRFDTKEECEQKCDPCELPKDPGPCKAYMPRWYYNSATKQCEEFIYGGCLGNDNRFDTEEECQAQCASPDTCKLPADPGPCKAYMPRWYYNYAAGKCQKFIYGGCGGNDNRFDNKKECELECDLCYLKPDSGYGKLKKKRWYYDSGKGCMTFSYSGKGGNANNFKNKRKCRKRCCKGGKCL